MLIDNKTPTEQEDMRFALSFFALIFILLIAGCDCKEGNQLWQAACTKDDTTTTTQ